MKASETFVKTFKTISKDETAISAQYLLRAGYIHKEMAGVYTFLPLGLKVIENIKDIIREELNAIHCQEISMTALQNPEPWQKSGRWADQDIDIWFKTELSAGGEVGLAPTHEEPITNMMKKYISSYKDLPAYVYQFQTKFRNELRAKSGILRGREFLMKDLYSFSADDASHMKFYHQVEEAYRTIFDRLNIGDSTYQTFASGGIFAKYSHEFQTVLPIGEDTIYYNQDKSVVLNEEVLNDEVLNEMGVTRDELESTKSAEVANIFTLKYKYSKPLDLNFINQDGEREYVTMGCYGIGVSRLMGVIAEKFADDKGLIWPESIAPFRYYLIAIGDQATNIANDLHSQHPDLFYFDDTDNRPGAKFADADLIGLPYRAVISDKTLQDNKIEITNRLTGQTSLLTIDDFVAKL
ncbi:prolyl-tRNA synthetase [Candidatus Saccharibacteria bacterium]|nr:prolyl-tRNA synthetase [Candidatus Saccharibacteria bacterium]